MKNRLNILNMNRHNYKNLIVLSVMLLITVSFAVAQKSSANTETLTGVVRDAYTKKPIVAAQLSIPTQNLSAITDENGAFTLQINSTFDVLHITAYDYNKREVAIRGKKQLTIDLYSDKFGLYFTDVEGLTGVNQNSTQVSSTKTITNLKQNTSLVADELIQNAFGGDVRATSRSAVSGIGSTFFIRGINSINANAQPLFVIDGVIWNNSYDVESIHNGFFSNPLDVIDVNDIEKISVIKDGSSIYGSKGSNGVIIINTKRATSMVTKISLNILTGMTERPATVPMMNGEQYRVYANEMLNTKGVLATELDNYTFMETNPANLKAYNSNHNNTNWSDQVYQTGLTNSYLINATGGDEKALYYFSLGYTNNKGVVKTTDFERILARFNADMKLTNKLDMGLNIGFNRVERSLVDDGMHQYASPTWVSQIKSPFLSPYGFTNQGEITRDYAKADEFEISNPSGLLKYGINTLTKYRFNIGVNPSLKITPELTLSTMFDYSILKTVEDRFMPMDYTPSILIEGYGISLNEINSQVMRNTSVYDDTRLTYEKKFDNLSKLKAIYGFRYINNYFESDYAEQHNSGSNNNTTITGSGANNYLQATGLNNKTKSISNYLNVDYSFNNKYFVNGAVAMDASSRFGRDTEGGIQLFGASWGVFPSINGAWLASSEEFMKNIDFVDFAKIRAGYGITGNDGIEDYESQAYFSSIRWMNRANGLILSNLENTKVQWENTAKAHLGLDLVVLNDRLTLNFDVFSSKTDNLLILRNLPDISGLSYYWDNGGKMENKGYELSVNLKVLNLKNLKWELGASVGHYANQVTELPDGNYTTQVYEGEVITAVGQPVGSFYGYKTAGVFATEEQANAANLKIQNADGSFSAFNAGDVIFEEVVADGIIDEKDKQVIGNPNPDFYGSINSKWMYKRFTLNTLFSYSYGNDIYNYYRSQLESGKDFNNQTSIMNTRWTAEGQVTSQPKAVYGDPMGNSRFSNRWIEDGSYLRLKTVTLSYDLPIKNDYIQGFSIWVSANNLLTFSNYLGIDPEFSAKNSVYYQGVDAGLLPLTKSYFLGIKLNL